MSLSLKKSFFCTLLIAFILHGGTLTFAQNLPSLPAFVKPVEKEKLPASLEYKGDFQFAFQWMEGKKRQVLIASEVKHPTELRNDLHLRQYGFGNGRYGVVWTLKEFAPKLCQVKLLASSLQIVDWDGDGKNEVSFSYQVDHKEGQPTVKKAILYQSGVKYAIRGKFSAEEGEELETEADSAVAANESVVAWYLQKEWERVKAGGEAFVHSINQSGENWFLLESHSVRGLERVYYDLRQSSGASMEMADSLHTRLQYARAIYPTRQGGLMYVSDQGIGTVNPATGQAFSLLDLPETTEGVSPAAWSPDSSMVALVVLNVDEYPKSTRLFVLEFSEDGAPGEVHEIDVLVSHYGFDVWTIEAPVFVNDSTLKVLEVPWDQESDGAWTEFELR